MKEKPNPSITEIFATNLRNCRLAQGLSRKKLAALSGVSETAINSYEQGIKTAGIDKVEALAWALEVPVKKLITIADNNEFHDKLLKCYDVLKLANIGFNLNLNNGDFELHLPPKVNRSVDGTIAISEIPPPIVIDLDALNLIVDRALQRVIVNSNMREIIEEIIEEELQRLQ